MTVSTGDPAMKRILNKTFRTFHIWTGLTIGAIFCVISLSGSVLVLRPAIEDLFRPAWTAKSDARPAQVLTEARNNIARLWPDAKIASVSLPDRSADRPGPIEFGLRDSSDNELRVFADASSGEVLGTFALPWLGWLTDLHHHILVESIGKRIVGFIGLFLVLSNLTGLLIWVRRSSRWRLFGTRRGNAWQYTGFDLHRSVGVIGNVLLLFVAATGVIIAFPQTITQLLGGPPPPRPVSVAKNSGAPATLEEYVVAAEHAIPGGTVRQLRLPRTPDRPVNARIRMPGDLRQGGSGRVNLQPATARVLSIDRPEDWPISKSIVQASTPLHYAEWGGVALRIVWFLIGLMPPVLFVTGVMMWWAPFAARRKAARALATRGAVREENLVA
jgi:uncharacterized iron-regulated membrane protein